MDDLNLRARVPPPSSTVHSPFLSFLDLLCDLLGIEVARRHSNALPFRGAGA